jgi:ferrous iron transport protein B
MLRAAGLSQANLEPSAARTPGSGRIFVSRVGGIILALMIVLWFLSSYPAPPEGATGPPIQYSFAGRLGALLEYLFAPIGFNWQISIALVPGLAAREVAVGALGTVYSMAATGEAIGDALLPVIAAQWSVATGLAMLAWYGTRCRCRHRRGPARDRQLAYPSADGGLPLRAGVSDGVHHIPHRLGAGSLK